MTKDEIFQQLQKILVSSFALDANDITLDAQMTKDLDLDSIDLIDLLTFVRKEIDCNITPEDYKKMATIGDIVEVIYHKTNAN